VRTFVGQENAMRADAHEQRAQQLEHAISKLGDPATDPNLNPGIIELYWGSAFHWIAFGCQAKYGKHAAAVTDILQSLAVAHPEAQAVILFGSVARHEDRPLDDPQPSDVDLMLVLDPGAINTGAVSLTRKQELALHHTIGEADYRGQSPCEITFVFVNRDLARWDDLFIENVARDGILLWARESLPARLSSVAERRLPGEANRLIAP
jgi:predicted nucleotidyltransferase